MVNEHAIDIKSNAGVRKPDRRCCGCCRARSIACELPLSIHYAADCRRGVLKTPPWKLCAAPHCLLMLTLTQVSVTIMCECTQRRKRAHAHTHTLLAVCTCPCRDCTCCANTHTHPHTHATATARTTRRDDVVELI